MRKDEKEKTFAKVLLGLIVKAEDKNIIKTYQFQQDINKIKVILERMAI